MQPMTARRRRRWRSQATVLFDAELDAREQVVALVERVGGLEEGVAQPLLDGSHAVRSCVGGCQTLARGSSEPRWSFECGETALEMGLHRVRR